MTTTEPPRDAPVARRDTAVERPVDTSIAAPLGGTRVTWGAVWAGLIVALATYLLLELALFAAGARELEVNAALDEDAAMTGLAALVALFLGGLVAGTTMRWTATAEGALHGLLVWATTIVSFLVLSVAGAGLALGGIGTAAGEIGLDIDQLAEEAGDDFDAARVTDDAQDAAGIALIAMAVTLLAAVAGGAFGSGMGADRRARRAGAYRDLAVR